MPCCKEARLVIQVELGFHLSTYWLSKLLHLSVSRLPQKWGMVNHAVCGWQELNKSCSVHKVSGLVPGTK